jgi:hypothetical protein
LVNRRLDKPQIQQHRQLQHRHQAPASVSRLSVSQQNLELQRPLLVPLQRHLPTHSVKLPHQRQGQEALGDSANLPLVALLADSAVILLLLLDPVLHHRQASALVLIHRNQRSTQALAQVVYKLRAEARSVHRQLSAIPRSEHPNHLARRPLQQASASVPVLAAILVSAQM